MSSEYWKIRRGWFWMRKFIARMLDHIDETSGKNQTQHEQDETMEHCAKRIISGMEGEARTKG
jgi:hypothetical protein